MTPEGAFLYIGVQFCLSPAAVVFAFVRVVLVLFDLRARLCVLRVCVCRAPHWGR